eukprot:GHVS01039874.1.p1 GENE.GHVS01039874.1~~GHVS01039874.1.p1  ORF type:complete len:404 (+),score=61.87 GHVS01039874.1:104-1315(+)
MASSTYKLLFNKGDPSACKCMTLFEYAGVDVKQDTNMAGGSVGQKTVEAVSPLGRLPVLMTPYGGIWGSEAVGRYISCIRRDVGLCGHNIFQSAQVDLWVSFCCNELAAPLACLVHEPTHAAAERSLKDAETCLSVVEKHLLLNTFLAAEVVTMADVWLLVALLEAKFKNEKIAEYIQKSCPNLSRWMDTCCNQKQIKKQLTAFGLGGDSKAAPAKPAKKESKDEDMEDMDEAPPKKVANALDSLPPTTMVLDEWKRCYSNTKDLYGEAMKWFWNNLDSAGWSLWYMKYDKLEGECDKAFLTSNLLGGFLQRIEPTFRKYSFGVIDVVQDKSNGAVESYDIQGVLMVRGAELPLELKEHVQYESHTFTKLDLTDPKHRKLIEDYWCADETVEDRVIADSKVWK